MANALLVPIWGQSNANGFYQLVPSKPYINVIPNVKVWNYTGTPAFQNLQIGVNNDIDTGAQLQYPYFGMELNMGYLLAQRLGETVYIMKFAQQNTTMFDNWNASTGTLYPSLITHIQDAMTAMTGLGLTVKMPCMVSYQGESDGITSQKANAYLASREAMYTAIKSALSLSSLIDIFVRIQSTLPSNFNFQKTVYDAQGTLQSNDPTNKILISSDGLGTADGTHINSLGQIYLGRQAAGIIQGYYP